MTKKYIGKLKVMQKVLSVIKSVLKKARNRGDSDKTLHYFLVNNPKLGRFYLLPRFTNDFIIFQVDQ